MPRHQDYTVAIICAIGFEMSAVRYMLDDKDEKLEDVPGDSNSYILGKLSGHHVVLAWLPGSQGKGATATVATNLARTFPAIKWRFLVGIGGGVPSKKHDIRLGDVVVSMPDEQHGGVVQYDLGKDRDNTFTLKGFLKPPPARLRAAIVEMESDHLLNDSKIENFVSALVNKGRKFQVYRRPSTESDFLFEETYPHVENENTCDQCEKANVVKRPTRDFESPEIHYGLIGSGDRVIKSADKRNLAIKTAGDILCFEMEAAGLATEFSCIVIRGISDYADSHKNDDWQKYAAATAAGCLKELLSYVKPEVPTAEASSDNSDQVSGNRPSIVSHFNGRGISNTGTGNFSANDININ